MGFSTAISRFAAYYSRHGFRATIGRLGESTKRSLSSGRMVVFYCDLGKQTKPPPQIPSSLKILRLGKYAELDPQDLQAIISVWNPKLAHSEIRERFDQGAALWLIKSEGELAGYSWTLRGRTIAPFYFLLGEDDVQLFDFYVLARFRGRAILWFLVLHILHSLKAEGAARVFGDVAEWNDASLSFYKMTPFRRLGLARTFKIFGHTFVSWSEARTMAKVPKGTERNDRASAMARSNE